MRYVEDGRINIDNNPVENAIRGIAPGRKNYLFCGSEGGGHRAALMYSLIESAKINGINPGAYLLELLTCELAPLWSHLTRGLMVPLKSRANGASEIAG